MSRYVRRWRPADQELDVASGHTEFDDDLDSTVEGVIPALVDPADQVVRPGGDVVGPEGDEVDLATDPFDDDLSQRLTARSPLQFGRVTLGLIGLVLVVAGFLGGVLVQQNFGTTG